MVAASAGRAARQPSGPHGQVLVIFALALVALFAAAGLAIDIGRFYMEKRYLQNAADAGALAVANAMIRGASDADARAEGMAVIARNFQAPPNGITPYLPPGAGSEVYASGHAGEPAWLLEGILISGGEVRVAVHNHIPYTFGRIVGLQENVIYGQARVQLRGNLLPIAVRRFVNAPGPSNGSYPCNDNQNQFMDFFATADTACLGTETDSALRVSPNAGAAFDPGSPDNDRANHGPIVEILGSGADPDNGADFRGFINLDIRNFASDVSQIYYNGVTPTTNANTLKDMEAAWFTAGGYPGPMFAPAVTPPDPNNQVATLDGNSAGIAIAAFSSRFAPGDEILVAVYPGITMEIPDFSLGDPGTIALPTSGTTATAGSFKVSRNQAFSGTVDLSTVADEFATSSGPAAVCPTTNPFTSVISGGTDPVTYTPDPVTPSLGSGETVTMTNVTTPAGTTAGIHTIWIQGQAGSPYLTTKLRPAAVRFGTVGRDFSLSSDAALKTASNAGDTVTFTINLRRSGSAFNGTGVHLFLEPLPGGSLPSGMGSVSFSATGVAPGGGSGTNVTLSINTGTMAPGAYNFAVRACGVNGDGLQVTRVVPISVNVATASSAGDQEYVDIVGFAVMRVAAMDSNAVSAYAITPVISDPNDNRLRRGQVARLVPWT
ncbi:MAG TPA: pilus assembly protein TadG-related protein [Candidatus Limnocylindrales bacterium]|nr:pilus assembly protein TadG-related protein [Candidatus Limnocylindrales bacterium]